MLSYLNAPDSFLSDNNPQVTMPAVKQPVSIYIKPVLLAIGTTVLLSFLVCIAFVGVATYFVPRTKTPAVQPSQTLPAQTGKPVQDGIAQQNNLNSFVDKLKETRHARVTKTAAGTFVTVSLDAQTLYRLHHETSYQELATLDKNLLSRLMQQLDARGIEYEVVKNRSSTVLLCSGEWIISWGGLLYLPDVAGSF